MARARKRKPVPAKAKHRSAIAGAAAVADTPDVTGASGVADVPAAADVPVVADARAATDTPAVTDALTVVEMQQLSDQLEQPTDSPDGSEGFATPELDILDTLLQQLESAKTPQVAAFAGSNEAHPDGAPAEAAQETPSVADTSYGDNDYDLELPPARSAQSVADELLAQTDALMSEFFSFRSIPAARKSRPSSSKSRASSSRNSPDAIKGTDESATAEYAESDAADLWPSAFTGGDTQTEAVQNTDSVPTAEAVTSGLRGSIAKFASGFASEHPQLAVWWPLLAFPLVIIYFEGLLKWRSSVDAPGRFYYPVLFSITSGIIVALLSSSSKSPRRNRVIAVVTLSLIALWFVTQLLIHQSFSVYMSPFFMGGNAGGVVGSYGTRIADIAISGLPSIILYAAAIVAVWFVAKALPLQQARLPQCVTSLGVAVVAQFSALVILATTTGGIIPDNAYYRSNYDINQAVQRFGLLTATRLDAQYTLTGVPQAIASDAQIGHLRRVEPEPETIDRSPNVLPIDFAALAATESNSELAALHNYYATQDPTAKNEYTGLFEGKNLIIICAEAFSGEIVTPELFPTIYRLTHNGFYFSQYYQPAWGGSTSTGEWSELTGLFPNGAGAMSDSRSDDMSFTIAPALNSRGYTSWGFHNNNFAYYDRDVTHPNLGYEWLATGNGMMSLPNPVTGATGLTDTWPRSDLEMMQVTLPLYLKPNAGPFNIYYMTLSGHALYNWGGNAMSYKNRERVENLPYSEAIKGYIAANLELEDAMTYLVAELTRAGILDDTVIVMTNDHYPYGLEANEVNNRDYWADFLGVGPSSSEYYRSSWILYNSAMETVKVTKPTYSLDILPTLLNLFGVPYDSRIFTGKDALAPDGGLVIFPDLSWISPLGAYDSVSDTFTPSSGSGAGDAYARNTSNAVRAASANAKSFQRWNYWARVKPK